MRQLPGFLADRYRFYCTWTLLPVGITYRDFGRPQNIPNSTSLIRQKRTILHRPKTPKP